MSDHWMDRLSEYVDGELNADERRGLEAHLAECGACREVLADLGRIVEAAHALEDRAPTADLWSGIAERIGAAPAGPGSVARLESHVARKRARRRVSFSLPQLAAASVALMIVSAAAAWMLSGSGRASGGESPEAAISSPAASGNVLVSEEALPQYDAAVAELQRLIADRRDELDPETVRIIEENLRVIDKAIAQARRAVQQDPSSAYLSEHLAATMRQKLEFLQQAASMARAAS